jgi:hypothetical protein
VAYNSLSFSIRRHLLVDPELWRKFCIRRTKKGQASGPIRFLASAAKPTHITVELSHWIYAVPVRWNSCKSFATNWTTSQPLSCSPFIPSGALPMSFCSWAHGPILISLGQCFKLVRKHLFATYSYMKTQYVKNRQNQTTLHKCAKLWYLLYLSGNFSPKFTINMKAVQILECFHSVLTKNCGRIGRKLADSRSKCILDSSVVMHVVTASQCED